MPTGSEPGEYAVTAGEIARLDARLKELADQTFNSLYYIAQVVESQGRTLDHLTGADLVDDCEPWPESYGLIVMQDEDDDYIDPAMLDDYDSRGI